MAAAAASKSELEAQLADAAARCAGLEADSAAAGARVAALEAEVAKGQEEAAGRVAALSEQAAQLQSELNAARSERSALQVGARWRVPWPAQSYLAPPLSSPAYMRF